MYKKREGVYHIILPWQMLQRCSKNNIHGETCKMLSEIMRVRLRVFLRRYSHSFKDDGVIHARDKNYWFDTDTFFDCLHVFTENLDRFVCSASWYSIGLDLDHTYLFCIRIRLL